MGLVDWGEGWALNHGYVYSGDGMDVALSKLSEGWVYGFYATGPFLYTGRADVRVPRGKAPQAAAVRRQAFLLVPKGSRRSVG